MTFGSSRRALGALAAGLVLAAALPPAAASAHRHIPTLTIQIPGTLSGCYFYSSATSDAVRAVLDLVRPSAFTLTYQGTLVGAPGPIASAELVSLAPQTVVYTVSPGWTWSNGRPFTGEDLVNWYQDAVSQPTSLTDGYRDIGSVTVGANDDQVTVVFSEPFSDWTTLFRDVGERGESTTCSLRQLAGQPSLGPYVLDSVSATQADLSANPLWRGQAAGFPEVVVRTDASAVRMPSTVVDYRYGETAPESDKQTSEGYLMGRTGSSNQLVVVGFSPTSPWTRQLAVRQFLGFAIDRQSLINDLVGTLTYAQGPAASTIFPEGSAQYPGPAGLGPLGQETVTPATTVPSSEGTDCVACAPAILAAAGYLERSGRWFTPQNRAVALTLGVGPSAYDVDGGNLIARTWRADGVAVSVRDYPSDLAVVAALRSGDIDAGAYTVQTGVEPFVTARDWTGVDYGDDYNTGWRSPLIDQWYASALNTFNPDDTVGDYQNIDNYIAEQAWERPLFTEPSILSWSVDVSGVDGSLSLEGLFDQVSSWNYTRDWLSTAT